MEIIFPAGGPVVDGLAEATASPSSEAAGSAPVTVETSSGTAVEQIALDLEAGKIDRATAVERLLTATVEDPAFASLSPEQRGELRQVLADLIDVDPSLGALVGALGPRTDDR